MTHQSVNECTQLRVVERMSDWHEIEALEIEALGIEALGIEALEAAVRYACVSLNVDDVEGIADAIRRADTRGIHTDALLFGKRA